MKSSASKSRKGPKSTQHNFLSRHEVINEKAKMRMVV